VIGKIAGKGGWYTKFANRLWRSFDKHNLFSVSLDNDTLGHSVMVKLKAFQILNSLVTEPDGVLVQKTGSMDS
jgi:hypothetical protein